MDNEENVMLTDMKKSRDLNQEIHFFWRTESPFSQWHTSKYELHGLSTPVLNKVRCMERPFSLEI
jgi:hypothetical protein